MSQALSTNQATSRAMPPATHIWKFIARTLTIGMQ
jgi:hypothetical protein